ncbi:MAG: class I SAM-dependent methyltransferase [Patescibacteria group bacterium]|nr:class I SAM-dependent methyltransferase [Patescibacteria group bacterium]
MNKKSEALLAKLEKESKNYWNIPREVAEFLYTFALSIEAETILEIGTSNGYSGIWLANACKKLYTVESHMGRFELAKKNFEKAGVKVEQIKGHAPEVIKPLKTKFDLAFIDATKCEYPLYLKAILPKLNKGGYVIADNIDSHRTGLVEFFKVTKPLKTRYLPLGAGLLIIQKR